MEIVNNIDRYNSLEKGFDLYKKDKKGLPSNKKKFKRLPISQIKIRLASPEQIKKWCSRTLPGVGKLGEITSAQTVDYKTLRPIKDGLFCERIFGPIKDFQCACGKNKNKEKFCPNCGVEHASSRIRRYNLGYIQLNSPVTHIWFLKGRVSYISILLGYKRKELEHLTSCETVLASTKSKTKNNFLFSPTFFKETPTYLRELPCFPSNAHDFDKLSNHYHRKTPSKRNEVIGSFYYNLFKKDIREYIKLKKSNQNPQFRKSKNGFSSHLREGKIMYVISNNYPKKRIIKPIALFSSKKFKFEKTTCTTFFNEKPEVLKDSKTLFYKKISKNSEKFETNSIEYNEDNELKLKIQEKIVKSFLQPTICPYLPEIERQVYDERLGEDDIPLDEYKRPIWDNQGILTCFTVLPENGDIPIPEYSQLAEYSETTFLQYEFYSNHLFYNQKHLANTGGFVIKEMLKELNLPLIAGILKKIIIKVGKEIFCILQKPSLSRIVKRKLRKLKNYQFQKVRCAKITRDLIKSKVQPEWMTLSIIPVLPPDLRPIIQLDGDQLAVSDLNKTYQNIFYRNESFTKNRITPLKKQALLQKAVDGLIENGKGGNQSMCASNGRPLKSLSDILKGKKGRFRQNLLGKRVDYSGRSVIVVGPTLKVDQCGLPKEMAIELFHPFLIRYLMRHKRFKKRFKSIYEAKKFIERKENILWSILEQVMQKSLVLLNRAPTLHRLGIQAFQSKLVSGRAILLHPLVCTGFNADFDGDQMAVHIPLSYKAQAEATQLMWSVNNLLSPATGQPILVPSQDMILGCNYLTYLNSFPLNFLSEQTIKVRLFSTKKKFCGEKPWGKVNFESFFSISSQANKTRYFSDFNDLLKAYYQKKIDLHAPVWVRTNLTLETENTLSSPLEIRIKDFGESNQIFSTFQYLYNMNNQKVKQYLRTTPGRVLVNQIFFDEYRFKKK